MRIMVYGDSNSWGTPPDGSGLRFDEQTRWPAVMAARLGATLIEEALPGRTTVHDDSQMLGGAMNGLTHLPVALKSNHPLDLVLIALGTNDFKARFDPDAGKIAQNIGRLVSCIADIGGGPGPWDGTAAPRIGIIAPAPLSELIEHPDWERRDEWRGGRAASLGLAAALTKLGVKLGLPVFDAASVVQASRDDPIHLDAAAHITLGVAVADWVQKQGLDA